MIICRNTELYRPGEIVKSLVIRPPAIQVGTEGKILNRWVGTLYAVKMPNGDLYRGLDSDDLIPVDSLHPNLRVGDLAVINLDKHKNLHFYHPQLENGTVVKVIKMLDTDYYEVELEDGKSYGWLTGFEISNVF